MVLIRLRQIINCMAHNSPCMSCEYVYDASSEYRNGKRSFWTCPCHFDVGSENCFKRDELKEGEDEDMEIKVTIGLTEIDRELVRDILTTVKGHKAAAPDASADVPTPRDRDEVFIGDTAAPEPKEEKTKRRATREKPKPEPEPEPEEEPATVEEPDVAAEEVPEEFDTEKIREEALSIFRKHVKTHKAKIKGLLFEYGADGIRDVPEEALSAFYKQLKELVAA